MGQCFSILWVDDERGESGQCLSCAASGIVIKTQLEKRKAASFNSYGFALILVIIVITEINIRYRNIITESKNVCHKSFF